MIDTRSLPIFGVLSANLTCKLVRYTNSTTMQQQCQVSSWVASHSPHSTQWCEEMAACCPALQILAKPKVRD
eukprot:3376115-Amphidinium_carterae.1